MGKVAHDLFIRHPDIDLFCNIEVSIQKKIDQSLSGEMEVQIAGKKKDSNHIKKDKKGDLGLQSKSFFGDPSVEQGSDPLEGRSGGDQFPNLEWMAQCSPFFVR
jgi:hypothetical protein